MAVITNNLQLVLPEPTDNISSLVFYENFQKIDSLVLPRAGGAMTGELKLSGYSEKVVSVSGISINPTIASVFTKNVSADTTFEFDTASMTAGYAYSITSVLTMGTTAYAVTFPGSVNWPGGEAPSFEVNTTTELVLRTYDGGSIWYGSVGGVF